MLSVCTLILMQLKKYNLRILRNSFKFHNIRTFCIISVCHHCKNFHFSLRTRLIVLGSNSRLWVKLVYYFTMFCFSATSWWCELIEVSKLTHRAHLGAKSKFKSKYIYILFSGYLVVLQFYICRWNEDITVLRSIRSCAKDPQINCLAD